MNIMDKITPELKRRFKEDIRKTIDTGKEHGFFLCTNDKISASEPCVGSECDIPLRNPQLACPGKMVQGEFHTHPLIRRYGSKEIIVQRFRDAAKREGLKDVELPINIPSSADITNSILNKCKNIPVSTVCIGSDADPDNVTCWTMKKPKNIIEKFKVCSAARKESIEIYGGIIASSSIMRKWMYPIYKKETIMLD